MRLTTPRFFLLAGLLLTSSLQATDSELDEQIRAIVESKVREPGTVGVSVAVARGDDFVFAEGFGFADLEHQIPATKNTVYRIGSVTKQFTAAAIMKLIEAGELALDDDLRDHFDGFDTGDKTVTIEQLLTHTSGIRSYTSLGPKWLSKTRLDLSHDELLGLVAEEPFDFEPGRDWRYNNTGYYLLGVLIEELLLETYADHMRAAFFEPLGMESTRYGSHRDIIPNRAQGYEMTPAGLRNCDFLSMNQPFAAGALLSTVVDLIRWQRGLVSGAAVSPASFDKMKTAGHDPSGRSTFYGYGLQIGELMGATRIGHGGGIHGFLSYLAWYPEHDVTVVVLANSMSAASPSRIETEIARAVLGLSNRETAVPLSAEDAERYVGDYQVGPQRISVKIHEGQLTARAGMQLFSSPLRHLGDHRFIVLGKDDQRVRFRLAGERAEWLAISRRGELREGPRVDPEGWITIFNGRDLDGWTPKIRGYELGHNHNDTFRVEDGVLKVGYDRYESFDREFGHLFYAHEYGSYDIRLEYRFVGDQVPGGPGWAFRNSGIMVHGQEPSTMGIDQEFPVSIEVQLLGGGGTHDRSTGNLCSPGTNVEMNDELITAHCVSSSSKTIHGDVWVTAEVQVRGGDVIRHLIDGELVLEYQRPQLDGRDEDARAWIERQGGELLLKRGSISLQAESHACEFRNIRLRPVRISPGESDESDD